MVPTTTKTKQLKYIQENIELIADCFVHMLPDDRLKDFVEIETMNGEVKVIMGHTMELILEEIVLDFKVVFVMFRVVYSKFQKEQSEELMNALRGFTALLDERVFLAKIFQDYVEEPLYIAIGKIHKNLASKKRIRKKILLFSLNIPLSEKSKAKIKELTTEYLDIFIRSVEFVEKAREMDIPDFTEGKKYNISVPEHLL